MNGFQFLGTSIAALFGLIALIGLFKRRVSRASALFWLAVWTSAGVAILNPEWTRIVAEVLGIARGADLVFYLSILTMFMGFFLVFAKLRRLDRTMTRIVRDIAIGDAGGSDEPERDPTADRR